jgi:hypothetical protein
MRGTVLHSTGDGQWTIQWMPPAQVTAIWGSGPTDIYAAAGALYHSTGDGNWTAESLGSSTAPILAVWGSGPNDVYAAGPSDLWHSSGGGTWVHQQQLAGAALVAVWGNGSTDVYAGGASSGAAAIWHSTGDGTWTPQTLPSGTGNLSVNAFWGSAPTDVYAVGTGPLYDSGFGLHDPLVLHSIGDGNWSSDLGVGGLNPCGNDDGSFVGAWGSYSMGGVYATGPSCTLNRRDPERGISSPESGVAASGATRPRARLRGRRLHATPQGRPMGHRVAPDRRERGHYLSQLRRLLWPKVAQRS